MEKKKGQGLSFNVIIIVIIGILVLVVASLIFSGKIQWFNTNTAKICDVSDCENAVRNMCPGGTVKGFGEYSTEVTESEYDQCKRKARKPVLCCISIS
jgi:hypothetical protein